MGAQWGRCRPAAAGFAASVGSAAPPCTSWPTPRRKPPPLRSAAGRASSAGSGSRAPAASRIRCAGDARQEAATRICELGDPRSARACGCAGRVARAAARSADSRLRADAGGPGLLLVVRCTTVAAARFHARSAARLFRKASSGRQRGRLGWVSRCEARGGLGGDASLAARAGPPGALSGPSGRYLVAVELQQIVGGGD